MLDRRHLLKIKLKSLAAEARIIRKAERQLAMPDLKIDAFRKEDRDKNPEFIKRAAAEVRLVKRQRRAEFRAQKWYAENRRQLDGLRNHRVLDVREESRATGLAYGFLRGRTLDQIERGRVFSMSNFADHRVFERAARMAHLYGPNFVNKPDMERDINEWLKGRTLRRAVDQESRAQALVPWGLKPSGDLASLLGPMGPI